MYSAVTEEIKLTVRLWKAKQGPTDRIFQESGRNSKGRSTFCSQSWSASNEPQEAGREASRVQNLVWSLWGAVKSED